MESIYLEIIALSEKLHRQLLELVKIELDVNGIHDINTVQAMIVYHLGDLEITVGELTLRGCYLGSNVSYNLQRLVENDYIAQERSAHDRRSVRVRLSDKGHKLRQILRLMHDRIVSSLSGADTAEGEIVAAYHALRKLEGHWARAIQGITLESRRLPLESAA